MQIVITLKASNFFFLFFRGSTLDRLITIWLSLGLTKLKEDGSRFGFHVVS